MKCIKSEVGVIDRVNDALAETRVNTGEWSYVAKSEWKSLRINVGKKVKEKNTVDSPESNTVNTQITDAVTTPKKKKKERVADEKSKSKKKK